MLAQIWVFSKSLWPPPPHFWNFRGTFFTFFQNYLTKISIFFLNCFKPFGTLAFVCFWLLQGKQKVPQNFWFGRDPPPFGKKLIFEPPFLKWWLPLVISALYIAQPLTLGLWKGACRLWPWSAIHYQRCQVDHSWLLQPLWTCTPGSLHYHCHICQ